ncbi:hypothetical protein F7725_017617, partial [Dissostichus mawsoni]
MLTCDEWTSIVQEHFLNVTPHYIWEGKMSPDRFLDKEVADTVDNASNMDVAINRLQFVKWTQCTAKICAIILWIKRSSIAKAILQENQDI